MQIENTWISCQATVIYLIIVASEYFDFILVIFQLYSRNFDFILEILQL